MSNHRCRGRWRTSASRPGHGGTVATEQPSARRSPRLPPAQHPAFAGCLLTASELQVVRQLARGVSYETAAYETRRSVSTVRSLVHNAYGRLGVATIAQALAVCTSVGWLDEVPNDGALVETADRRVTWAQRLYLEAFDQTLRAGDDDGELDRTGQLRRAALAGVCREAGTPLPPPRVLNDPLERLVRDFRRLAAREED